MRVKDRTLLLHLLPYFGFNSLQKMGQLGTLYRCPATWNLREDC